ncbi:MAG: hypothetical protein IPM96_21545 [Ignavibacteria bacterium]|nr:hypothetical protein [Ignavibacteria bacterium]
MPSVGDNGNLAYSSYKPTGYKIAYLKNYTEHDPEALGKCDQPDYSHYKIYKRRFTCCGK